MKKLIKMLALGAGASVFAWAGLSMADESNYGRDFQAKSRLRFEYDDNIYETSSDKQDSFKIEEEVDLIYNMNFERTYVGLHYRPSFIWWSDRDPQDYDFFHEFDVDFTHTLSPRVLLAVKENFLYAEQPELIDRGVKISENDNYIYNRANADVILQLKPPTRLEMGGRYTLLRYDDDAVSDIEDYDIYAAGATIRHESSSELTVLGEMRGEAIAYTGPDRDSDSLYAGGGLEKIFSPNLLGSLRGGAQFKQFSADGLDSSTKPYFDGSFTLTPSPRTRLTTGAGYSMFEADVYPYANQDRLLIYANAAHDLTARVSLFLTVSYQNSAYNGDQSIDQSIVTEDGTEDVIQVAARGSYKINRSNWLEASYQYIDLSSDVRSEFDRNRVSVGWRTTL